MQIEFLLLHSSNQNRTAFQCIYKSIYQRCFLSYFGTIGTSIFKNKTAKVNINQ
jgi:hypothetical protein